MAITLGVGACGGGDSSTETDVAVSFSEWEIVVEPSVVGAGEVRFELSNAGELAHNLVIVKSDLPAGELPVSDGVVDTSKLNVVGGAGPIAPGPARDDDEGYAVSVSAGKYVLFCDVVVSGESHYRNGMFVSLLVEP